MTIPGRPGTFAKPEGFVFSSDLPNDLATDWIDRIPESRRMITRAARPMLATLIPAALLLCALAGESIAQGPPPPPPPLPPVLQPPLNPITEAKRVLGKILFWDEQLSSDNTVACGTCHKPNFGGTYSRLAINPGLDGLVNTPDDVRGSPGIARTNSTGDYVRDVNFNFNAQI